MFLNFLINRPFFSSRKTRMWFASEEIKTKALQKLVFKNANKLEYKMVELLFEFFESNDEIEINVVPQDILNMINRMFKQTYFTRNDVRNILKDKWKLEPQKNGLTYIRYDIDYSGNFYQNNSVGRYFTIPKNFITAKSVDLLN